MLLGNAFLHLKNGMFDPCCQCKNPQQCGTHWHCYIEICQSYNQSQMLGNQMTVGRITSLSGNFRRDYNMMREADSDGGECD